MAAFVTAMAGIAAARPAKPPLPGAAATNSYCELLRLVGPEPLAGIANWNTVPEPRVKF